jgi:hypothetical protein
MVCSGTFLMVNNLPNLRILPLNDLILHEDHDRQRTLPLVAKLRAQGILRNPPIVMPLNDGTGRFMVLDGANRVTSLQEMEFPHIVAQVVPYDDPHVYLGTWNHVVWGMSQRTLIADLQKAKEVELQKINTRKSHNPPEGMPAQVRLLDGSVYLATTAPDLSSAVAGLHCIVNSYKDRASLDRTSQTLTEGLDDVHHDLTALIIFPRFEVPTVLTLAGRGDVLPTGITRFTVSPRALHLNYPLHELSSGKPIEYKEAYLQHWIQERLKNKGVRHYAEATFLFDE